MNKGILLFGTIFIILFIESIQQASAPKGEDIYQQFNNALLRNLQEPDPKNGTALVTKMDEKLRRQVTIWTSIGLCAVLYFSVMAIIDMSNPKSSILYAKYDTTKGGNEIY